jgi:hypothetical protein
MESKRVILDQITFKPDVKALLGELHIREGSPSARQVEAMLRQAQAIARPKAIYQLALVEHIGNDEVLLDGVKFKSRIVRVNLNEVHRVFVYVATCGREIYNWAMSYDDPLERFWADAIMIAALGDAAEALDTHLRETYEPGSMSSMNPGSLEDWPMSAQIPLFSLLGNVSEAIGVTLTDSLLMVPTKSVSGIYFPTESGYANCQLCPRETCPTAGQCTTLICLHRSISREVNAYV